MFITLKIYLIFKYTTKFLFNPTKKKAQINLQFSGHIKVPSYLWVWLPTRSTLSCFKIYEWHVAHKWSKGRNKDASNPIYFSSYLLSSLLCPSLLPLQHHLLSNYLLLHWAHCKVPDLSEEESFQEDLGGKAILCGVA